MHEKRNRSELGSAGFTAAFAQAPLIPFSFVTVDGPDPAAAVLKLENILLIAQLEISEILEKQLKLICLKK